MSEVSDLTAIDLDQFRTQGDPLADRAAAALFEMIESQEDEKSKKRVSKFISEFVSYDFTQRWRPKNHEIKIPQELFDYFADLTPFDFTDSEKDVLERGSSFFVKHGPKVILCLALRSLLKQYAHTEAIQVLRTTTLLSSHVHRRVIETMQFVMDVMTPTWHHFDETKNRRILNTNHIGLQSIQKLRLVHAMIRFRIKHKMMDPAQGEWNDDWGVPINQEDMIFATHTFSIEVLEGLSQLKTEMSEAEMDDYFQTWSLIGRSLGVETKLIPDNLAEGVALQNKIYGRHFTLPNDFGPILSRALVEWFKEVVPLATEKTVMLFIKEVNGPENYELLEKHLGLPMGIAFDAEEDLDSHVESLSIPRSDGKVEGEAAFGKEVFFSYFIDQLLKAERGGKNQSFRIGDGFADSWNINNGREEPPSKLRVFLAAIWAAIKAFFLKTLGLLHKDEK